MNKLEEINYMDGSIRSGRNIDPALSNAMEMLTIVSNRGQQRQIKYWQLAVSTISKTTQNIREERDNVMKIACGITGVNPSRLFERYRGHEVIYARQLVYSHFAQKYRIYTGWTWMCLFGHHHTTVMNSLKQHYDLLQTSESYQDMVQRFESGDVCQIFHSH